MGLLKWRESSGRGRVTTAVAVLSAAFVFISPAAAQWSSFRQDPQLQGIAKDTLPKNLKVHWSIDAPDGVEATAAIKGGKVYAAFLSGDLKCLDLKDGSELWSYRSDPDAGPDDFAPGYKSSPAVFDGLVYIGDEDGVIHAVEADSGRRKWSYQTDAEIISSPTVVEGRLVVGSYDNNLYCFDPASGAKLWQVETLGYVHCTPAIDRGLTFIAGCDETLRVINLKDGAEVAAMPLGTYLISSPAVRDGLLYLGNYRGEIVAIDWRKKKNVWTFQGSDRELPIHSCVAVSDDRVVIGGRDKSIYCVDRKTGEKIWSVLTRGRVDSSPVISGNRVFVGSSDRKLYEIDLKTGEVLEEHNLRNSVVASPAIAEKSLVIGTEGATGRLWCLGE
ncbi:Outer membrane protein assembly factor BamB precursor [Stratiformator vulcanicus]|uniref:Outer membrane protein assembly factor BamB n=1 Tax=Stratiformator vulcanicus TaxID=2527980 RepID=A0A517R0T8_9PLAN|nr:Outer membrane protein assembly factor BamB precursor [Stratiformator vulcanicus]